MRDAMYIERGGLQNEEKSIKRTVMYSNGGNNGRRLRDPIPQRQQRQMTLQKQTTQQKMMQQQTMRQKMMRKKKAVCTSRSYPRASSMHTGRQY